jgi:uncharacterized membrane protein
LRESRLTERLIFALTFLSILGTGLVAGIFFAFSVFVMRALGRLPPTGGIAAMQSINVAVLNLAAFFGMAVLSLALAVVALVGWSLPYLLAGSLLYLVGTILVTIVFNVPLNNRLASVTPDGAEAASLWTRYLSTWAAWNHVGRSRRLLPPLVSSWRSANCERHFRAAYR